MLFWKTDIDDTMEKKEPQKGLLVVHTGDGKGKTTAALGIVFRALGRGMKCGVVQFIKGKWKTGEKMFAETLPDLNFHVMGLGFTWESDNLDRDKLAAQGAWQKSKDLILEGKHQVIVLDEITYVLNYGFVPMEDVVNTLQNRPSEVHVIVTGRKCPKPILDIADLISETSSLRHPYQKGIPAQLGIDF
jgi:cob(I)alamin adenosyltransferase